jgi:wyosine [tRNA(Phe)-imidazoG37] synthetase (radical SAM superfamily)
MQHLFGPVLSRRLGLSMGVDLLPYKTCNMDCIYCELGCTRKLTTERASYFSPKRVLAEIRSRADEDFDYLTFAGSGEPTLSSDLGQILRETKKIVASPLAVITNSSLLTSKEVRNEISEADVVLPSLDAATPKAFQAINRPAKSLIIEKIIEGLRTFRQEYRGKIWLEVMLVEDVNDDDIEAIARAAKSIGPDRVQLNTVIRPPAEPVSPLSEEKMLEVLNCFSDVELIPDWNWNVPKASEDALLDLLKDRRPRP